VYKILWGKNAGGFVLAEGGAARSYVKAGEMASAVIGMTDHDPNKLNKYCVMPIGQLLSIVLTSHPLAIVPLVPGPVTINSDESQLQNRPDAVFSVTDKDHQVGWYLNHEDVRKTATKRIVFICTNGHRNSDPDHGSCYQCPAAIDRSETE
jgi:hypothetical protein